MIKLICAKCGSPLMIERTDGDDDEPNVAVIPCKPCGEDVKQVRKAITTLLQFTQ